MPESAPSGGRWTRREFLHRSALGAAALGLGSLAPGRVLGANQRLNVGVIGCGGRGTGLLRDLVDRSQREPQRLAVVAVCDIYEPRKQRAGEISGAQVVHDYTEMLEMKDLDAVVIATPDHWHAPMSIDAARAGKHIYCEKPMTLHWREAKEVAAVVRQTGVVFQVGVQSTSEDRWWKANELIRAGALGKLIWSQTGAFRNIPGGDWNYGMGPVNLEDPGNPNYLDWKRFLGPAPWQPFDPERYFRFRKFWDYSGGLATDLLYHSLGHLAVALGPEFPIRVAASGGNFIHFDREVPDTFHVLADYPSRHSVALISTSGSEAGIDDMIRGQEATLFVRRGDVVVRPEGPFALRRDEDEVVSSEPRSDHITNFLESVRGNETPHCDVETGYRVMVTIGLSVEAYRQNRVMLFDPVEEEAFSS